MSKVKDIDGDEEGGGDSSSFPDKSFLAEEPQDADYSCDSSLVQEPQDTDYSCVFSHVEKPQDADYSCDFSHVEEPQDADYSSDPSRVEEPQDADYSSDPSRVEEPQDADYSLVPSLCYDLEALILAKVPISEYLQCCLVNKRFLNLMRGGEIFKIRRGIGTVELFVFMLAIGESNWWMFDGEFKSHKVLPIMPSDISFTNGDKESFCAGTDLIVSGREIYGQAIWRYELLANKWFKGPPMIKPRCLFASASLGSFAIVAGGISVEGNGEVLNSAEKYDPKNKSWSLLPPMCQKRKRCSGCYMDGKFYVIGGLNELEQNLTSGDVFDEARNKWNLIPNMLVDFPILDSQSPPLIAVASNELYSIDASSNNLMVYSKDSNSWKRLGAVPVGADFNRGWGVAFKSLGNELLVMGKPSVLHADPDMAIYTCCPHPSATELQWKRIQYGKIPISNFILNCSVMMA